MSADEQLAGHGSLFKGNRSQASRLCLVLIHLPYKRKISFNWPLAIKQEMSEMREELEEAEIENYEQRPFIPHDALKDLLPESKIATLISALAGRGVLEVYQQREIINAILDNGSRLFATLLSLSRPELILKFIETDHFAQSQLDSRLPLSHHSLGLILRDEKLSARFYKHQWKFLAPFFRADQSHRELEDNVILPFTDCKRLGEGGFGEVHQMTMVASYQGLVPEVKGQVQVS